MDTRTRKQYVEVGKMMHGVFFEFWECKCGNVEEISVSVDIEWNICEKCKRKNYSFKRNKKKMGKKKLSLKKYCKFCKEHTLHKESK